MNLIVLLLYPNSFFLISSFGVHVQIMQDCYIGTHLTMWFAASIPPSPTPGIFPMLSLPDPIPCCPSLGPLQQTLVCDAPVPVSICSHCSTPTYEWAHVVFDFLFLCQFAENDGFQIHPCPYKGHEHIFYDWIVFHGIDVSHFPCPVYRRWHLGWF